MHKTITHIVLDGYYVKCGYSDGSTSGGMRKRTMLHAERYAEHLSKQLSLPIKRTSYAIGCPSL